MAFSKIQIISLAIEKLGKAAITSVETGGRIAQSAENAYDLVVPCFLAGYDWRFATKLVRLSQLVETPLIDEWTHIYQLPADYLSLTRLYPNLNEYELYAENKLYTKTDTALYAEYRADVPVGQFPVYFVAVIVPAIAAHVALSVALKDDYYTINLKESDDRLSKALATNFKVRPNNSIQSTPLLDVRG